MNTKPIIFRQGQENGIVVERNNFDHSPFIDQYRKAFEMLKQIWEKQDLYIHDSNYELDNRFSNIIAFCGNRGEGKSSCMSSFSEMLQNEDTRDNACAVLNGYWSKSMQDFLSREAKTEKLELLAPIDPSFFDNQHNVLELLIGRMFKNMTDIIKVNKMHDVNSCLCSELQKQFQNVQYCMKNMVKGSSLSFDTLENISDLASAVQLRKEIDVLFQMYLEFVGKKDGRLIISIDDLDLKMLGAYEMSEYIRKYLINAHCIILIAVKVEQLVDAIADNMVHEMSGRIVKEPDFVMMANNYVSKFLPLSNRIIMPTSADICEHQLIIEDTEGNQTHINEAQGENYVTVKEYVVRLIFLKTGYVFYNTQNISPIIPNSLRSLRHLIALLDSAPDAVEYNDSKKIDHEEGRDLFDNYFYYVWTERLNPNDQIFVQTLNSYEDLPTLNKYVIDNFADRVKNAGILSEQIDAKNDRLLSLYNSIVKKSNVAANVSLGDVMFVLWWIDKMTMDIHVKNLIFWLRSFYSMKLYACYNDISREFVDTSISGTLYPSYSSMVNIHKADAMYNHVNSIQRLVNGSFFTYPQGYILQTIGNSSIPRDHKVITLTAIKKLFSEISKYDIHDASADYVDKLRLCEFTALTISRTAYNTEKAGDLGRNRTTIYPTYLGHISDHSSYAVFDILLPFYSLCNVQYTYNRFDKLLYPNMDEQELGNLQGQPIENLQDATAKCGLYNRAKINKDSLLNTMLNGIESDVYHADKMHNLLSNAVIRIIDVQWAIMDYLTYQRDKHKSQAFDVRKIAEVYKDIQNLNIKLYSNNEVKLNNPETTNSLYSIAFGFLNPIIRYLNGTLDGKRDAEANKLFAQTFESIFMPAIMEVPEKDIAEIEEMFANAWANINYPVKGEHATHIISNSTGKLKNEKSSLTRKLNYVLDKEKRYDSQDELITQLASQLAYIKK